MTLTAQLASSYTYTDFNGLSAMKTLAKKDYDKGLDEAAKQVEAVFLQMLLKSMQQATQVLKSDLLDSNESEQYQDLYSQQLGLTLGQNKSLGIAALIKQQLQHHKPHQVIQEST